MSSPNYKETDVSGKSYRRCRSIEISNPLDKAKGVAFQEEQITTLGEDVLRKPSRLLTEEFNIGNATTPFDLLNPEDNSVLGTMTYQEVYGVLYSLYLHVAKKADAD